MASSPVGYVIIKSIDRLEKSSAKVMHDMVLLRKEMASLRQAAETATKRKNRKRRHIKSQEALTVGEVADLVAPKEAGGQKEGEKATKRARAQRHCGRCGSTGHNARTCWYCGVPKVSGHSRLRLCNQPIDQLHHVQLQTTNTPDLLANLIDF